MCYYATTDYACGDWKWGNMMERCPRQHRIGETCGAKLVHHESITKSDKVCKICEEIQVKQRRLTRVVENIQRWGSEGDRFAASLDKARREGRELQEKIKELHHRRPSIVAKLNGQASGLGNTASAGYGGGLPSFGTNASTGGYTYTSSSQGYVSSAQQVGGYTSISTSGDGQSRPPGYSNVPAGNPQSRHAVANIPYQSGRR